MIQCDLNHPWLNQHYSKIIFFEDLVEPQKIKIPLFKTWVGYHFTFLTKHAINYFVTTLLAYLQMQSKFFILHQAVIIPLNSDYEDENRKLKKNHYESELFLQYLDQLPIIVLKELIQGKPYLHCGNHRSRMTWLEILVHDQAFFTIVTILALPNFSQSEVF